jgi:hypothetical protein
MKRAVLALAVLLLLATACDTRDLVLSPRDGVIVSEDHVTVSGHIPTDATPGGTLQVQGISTPIAPDGTWTAVVAVSTSTYVTQVEAIYTDPSGHPWRQRQAVVHGPKLDEGQASPDGVGMHFTNSGLQGLGPIVKGLAAGAFDIGSLLLSQNPIIEEQDALLTLDITGNAYEAGVGSVDLGVASTISGVATHITLQDLYVGVALNIHDGGLINIDCSLELKIPTTTIDATFDLAPSSADPSKVDVNLVGTPAVVTSNVGYEFISGICDGDTFVLGDIVNAVAGPQIQSLIGTGFSTKLGDPDGSGPADSPIADAIETALANISIAGSVGEAVHARLDAPFTQITEGSDAIDFRADADFTSSVGTDPDQCLPPAGAPDLESTFDVGGAFPDLGPTTPSGQPYGLGLTISASAFNQLLGAMTECGILNQEVTQIPFGNVTLPITAGLLGTLAPEFATKLPPATPMKIRVKPTVGPFVTSSAGPNGEPAELQLANLQLEFVENRNGLELLWLTLAVDTPLGFDLAYDATAGVLAPTITAAPAAQVQARVTSNLIGLVEPNIEAIFPGLFPSFVSALSGSFAAFPLPGFLGLKLDVAEVVRTGNYFVLYSNLLPELQTRLENVTVTDLSTADSVVDSVFDVNEWRHRIRPTVSATGVGVAYKAMLGADACCTVDDESKSAHAGYRIGFDVVPENGDTWHLDVSQLLNGAHTLIDEKVLFEDAGGETRFQSAVVGRVQVGGGAWQNFNVTPSVTSVVHGLYGGEGTSNRAFTGTNQAVLSGTTRQTITVEFGFDLFARSNSNAFFPAAGGDEVAIRLGANDTITNGFTAGGYPGLGNRSITGDGHFAVIQLTTTR